MATKDVQLRLVISAVNEAGAKLKEIGNQLSSVSKNAEEVTKASKKIGDAGAASVDKFGKALDDLKTKMEGVKKVGDKMVSFGTQLSLVGAGMLSTLVFPVTNAAKFEKQMSGVRAVTEGTAEQFVTLANKAKKLGAETKFTAVQAAEGLKLLGQGGLNAEQALIALEPVLNLAAAGELELAEAASVAMSVMQGLEMPVTELGRITDVLAKAAAVSTTEVSDMGEAFSYVAGDIATVRMPLEQAGAFLAVLADGAQKGTRGGTALRGVLSGLAGRIVPRAAEAFDRLGVSVSRNADGTVDFIKTLEDLHKAGAGLPEWQVIFGESYGAYAAGLARNVDKLRKNEQVLKDATGAGKEMAHILEDNLVGAFTRLKSAAEGASIAIGDPLLKPLKEITDAVAGVMGAITKWMNLNPIFASTMATVIGGIGGIALAIGAVLIPLGLLVRLVATALGGLGVLRTASIAAAAGLRNFAAATYAAATAGTALSTAFVALAAAWGAFQIYKAVEAFIQWRQAAAMAAESTRRLVEQSEALLSKHAGLKDFKLPADFASKSNEELKDFRSKLWAATTYAMSLKNLLEEKAKETNWLGMVTDEAKAAEAELVVVKKRLEELQGARAALAAEQQKRAPAAAVPEAEPIDPRAAAEKRADAIKATEKLRVSLMEEGIAKVNALRKLELAEFEASEEKRVLTAQEAQDRINLINQSFDKKIDETKKALAEKSINVTRQIREKEIQVAREMSETELRALEDGYQRGNVSLAAFLEERREIKLSSYDADIAEINKKIEEELDPDKKRVIQFELQVAEAKRASASTELDIQDRQAYESKLQQERDFQTELNQIKQEVAGAFDVEAAFELEKQAIIKQNEWRLAEYERMGIEKGQLLEMAAAQEEQLQLRVAEHEKQVLTARLDAASEIAGNIESTFADLYSASDEQVKAFFYIQKAAAFAEALISAYSAANKALNSPLASVSPTMAQAMSATILAAGMARAAMIAATTIKAAEGGLIKVDRPNGPPILVRRFADGGSTSGRKAPVKASSVTRLTPAAKRKSKEHPVEILVRARELGAALTPTRLPTTTRSGIVRGPKGRDVIPAWLTDNEYVMNPRAVEKYGVGFMEALNRRLIDMRDIMSPTVRLSRTVVLAKHGVPVYRAEGGPVGSAPSSRGGSAGGGGSGQGAAAQPVNIVNVVDSSLMDQYLSSNSGQKMVLNILSANQPAAQRAIMGRT
jgi:TP901 family phage tail tape measure protein